MNASVALSPATQGMMDVPSILQQLEQVRMSRHFAKAMGDKPLMAVDVQGTAAHILQQIQDAIVRMGMSYHLPDHGASFDIHIPDEKFDPETEVAFHAVVEVLRLDNPLDIEQGGGAAATATAEDQEWYRIQLHRFGGDGFSAVDLLDEIERNL